MYCVSRHLPLHIYKKKSPAEQLNMMSAKLKEGLAARSDVSEANAH